MNLLALRTKLVQLSGRYDLVVDTTAYADNGANFHIYEGQKYLSGLIENRPMLAQVFLPLAINGYSITFQNQCRNVTGVFVNSTSERYELEKVELKDLKTCYSELASAVTSGAPGYYALANLMALETTSQVSLGTFINLTHAESDTKYDYTGLIIVPPAEEALVVEITGKFEQKELSSDTDNNYWATMHPGLLLMAARRDLEIHNRNSEGVKDWDNFISIAIKKLNHDFIEEEAHDVDQLKG